MSDALAVILERRSASPRFLSPPVPDADQIGVMARAAASAPDHKQLRPYRFLIIPEAHRPHLAAAFRAAKLERDPASSAEDLESAAGKAFRGPLLIAVVLRILRDHPRVSVSDQMLTAGAAIDNMMLAASAMGFASCLRSGGSATSRKVREALHLAADEDLAAFLLVGTPSRSRGPRADDVSGVIETWAPRTSSVAAIST